MRSVFKERLNGKSVELPEPLTRKEQIIAGYKIAPLTAEEFRLAKLVKPKRKKK